jgi:hypothetical protein
MKKKMVVVVCLGLVVGAELFKIETMKHSQKMKP